VPVKRPELRAPTADGAVVAAPPLEQVEQLLESNGRIDHPVPSEVRAAARTQAIGAARAYLRAAEEPIPATSGDRLIMAGHQPELFHPGVWVKNFALQGLARRHNAVALNLVVDNDTLKSASLRLPAPPDSTSAWPHAVAVPFDRLTGEIPYEERTVADPEAFASFADRAGAILAGWGYRPLLHDFWPEVLRQQRRTPLIGETFAAVRRSWERRWGCTNLEVPISAVCQTPAFAGFAAALLADLPRFHAVYNDAVHDYRRRHGLRSRNHPVPDLAEEDGWLEAPLWGWRPGQTRRGRLFARRVGDTFELRADATPWPKLPTGPGAARAWQELEAGGYKARSRALTTTLYARLYLADLFIHGIGGGKYDELTDDIIQRYYHAAPPAFVVLSATRWLPLPHYPTDSADLRGLQRRVRDLYWNPQRNLDAAAAATTPSRFTQKL
jgi:hypothetical protein